MGLKYFAPPHIKRECFANDSVVIAQEIKHLLVILLPSSLNRLRVYRKFYSCICDKKNDLIRFLALNNKKTHYQKTPLIEY